MSFEPYYNEILWFLRCGMWLWVIMLAVPIARWITHHYFNWESLAGDSPEDVLDAFQAYRPVDKQEFIQEVLGDRAALYQPPESKKNPGFDVGYAMEQLSDLFGKKSRQNQSDGKSNEFGL